MSLQESYLTYSFFKNIQWKLKSYSIIGNFRIFISNKNSLLLLNESLTDGI